VALHVIRLAAAGPHGPRRLVGGRARKGGARLLVVTGCAALLAAACGSGSSALSATSQQPDTPQGHLATSGASEPPTPNCPTTPVVGPSHTLTLPASIDGYQKDQDEPGQNGSLLVPDGHTQGGCNVAVQAVDYSNSQLSDLTVYVGHHASLWSSGNSFWSLFWAGAAPFAVSAGAQGGQAFCANGMGTNCVWYDNDTFGNVTCSSDLSQSQCLNLMYAFRAAIEQPG
jgi:hypothetical protein